MRWPQEIRHARRLCKLMRCHKLRPAATIERTSPFYPNSVSQPIIENPITVFGQLYAKDNRRGELAIKSGNRPVYDGDGPELGLNVNSWCRPPPILLEPARAASLAGVVTGIKVYRPGQKMEQ